MKKLIYSLFSLLLLTPAIGQMDFEGQSLFGNEWISLGNDYVKIEISKDGVYSLSKAQLESAGFPTSSAKGSEFQMFNYGKEVPIYVSSDNVFNNSDFIQFYGKQNDGRLDKVGYEDWQKQMLNPKFSHYTDTNVYYLTWADNSSGNERISDTPNNLNGNLPAAEPYFIEEEIYTFNEAHHSPAWSENKRYSHFHDGEGFGSELLGEHNVTFNVENPTSAGFAPYITARLGTYYGAHLTEISVNGQLEIQDQYGLFAAKEYNISLTPAQLLSPIDLNIKSTAHELDRSALAYAALYYPRSFDLPQSNSFDFDLDSGSERYFEFNNLTSSSDLYLLDTENKLRIKLVQTGNTSKCLLPAIGSDTEIQIFSETFSPDNISKWEPSDLFSEEDIDYIIVTSESLNNNLSGSNYIQDYADYRESSIGGEYNVTTVNVESLFDIFSYGIDGHAQALNNFGNYAKSVWPQLRYVFIVGKGLEYNRVRLGENEVTSHVPVYGVPGSDNLLFGAKDHVYSVAAVGRVAARSPKEVEYYLNKVKEHENPELFPQTLEGVSWRKEMIHLSGGRLSDQEAIFQGLESMREIIENNDFGANVTTYRKTTSDAIENTVSQQIIDNINNGVSLITFFGHSAVGTFDFSIENPDKYDNIAKYPLMISLGCLAGNIHTTSLGVSEKFVLAEQRGAIAFLAASGVATVTDQSDFGKFFYNNVGGDLYGKSIGAIIRAYIAEFDGQELSLTVEQLLEQLTLHADPAIVLQDFEGPDYTVDLSSIKTYPEVINSTIDSFEVEFDIVNLGKGQNVGLFYQLIHSFGGGKDTIVGTTITPENRKTLREKFANKGLQALGKNTIDIIVDQENDIVEFPDPLAEMNNRLSQAYANDGFCFFIYDTNARLVYPTEYAIMNKQGFDFIASAGNAFLDSERYIMEIDTTELFNSSIYKSAEAEASGGLIRFKMEYNYQPNDVYYWRVKNIESEEEDWVYSSFIYLPNESEGWNQSHYYQWLNDDYNGMTMSDARDFQFSPAIGEYRIVNTARIDNNTKPQFFYNNIFHGANDERNNGKGRDISSGVYVVVVDPITTEPWVNPPGGLYGTDVGLFNENRNMFSFLTSDASERAELVSFLKNDIPDGHYVLFWTIQSDEHSYKPQDWPLDNETIHSVLINEGAQMTNDIISDGPLPYIFAYVKGSNPEVLTESIVYDPFEELSVLVYTEGLSNQGYMCSPRIGPAKKWRNVKWDFSAFNQGEDMFSYNVIGIKPNGDLDTLFENVTDPSLSINDVSADQYPYIQLCLISEDSTSYSSAQMDFWRVVYDQLPEALINADDGFDFHSDTLFVGEQLSLDLRVENIIPVDMDSLLVKYTIVKPNNEEIVRYKTHDPLLGESTIKLNFSQGTQSFSDGIHELRVEINADREQKEQYYFNNLGFLNFLVKSDDLNPVLDVTFDGVRIMNGDIISPEPLISVNLVDDNTFQLLDDPNDFELTLEYPDGNLVNIETSGPDITFYPADGNGKNRARIEYNPSLYDGVYTLYAQARDKNGNFSGENNYEVEFEVINESSISNMINYPNPFSESTQFIFTLTGKEVPDDFVIRIMTLSGKVVREITMEEFGPIHAGVNRSIYRWNGTDAFGSRLANGVYIYKVFLSDESGSFEERYIENVDSFFKKGFGKMVIMR